jgi:hypothetical protein
VQAVVPGCSYAPMDNIPRLLAEPSGADPHVFMGIQLNTHYFCKKEIVYVFYPMCMYQNNKINSLYANPNENAHLRHLPGPPLLPCTRCWPMAQSATPTSPARRPEAWRGWREVDTEFNGLQTNWTATPLNPAHAHSLHQPKDRA